MGLGAKVLPEVPDERTLIKQGDGEEKAAPKMGLLSKEKPHGSLLKSWYAFLQEERSLATSDVTTGLGLSMLGKEGMEVDLIRKSSVLTNKVFRHKFVPEMERIIDEGVEISHEDLATYVQGVIEDVSKASKS